MSGSHWADGHVEWIHRRFPEIESMPLYVVGGGEVPEACEPGAVAHTAPALDLKLQVHLEAKGRWRGRGSAILVTDVADFLKTGWSQQVGILLHELTHCLEDIDAPSRTKPMEEWPITALLVLAGGNALLQKAYGDAWPSAKSLARLTHGPQFHRLALHKWWRCRWEVSLDDLMAFSPRYGSPEPQPAIEALLPELRESPDILTVARSPIPVAFSALWAK